MSSQKTITRAGAVPRVLRPLGVEYQIAFVVDVSPPVYVGIALSRGGRDYTDAERLLLDRARPYLIQIYRAAIA